jgi:trehalose 6-phosphate phosphatase
VGARVGDASVKYVVGNHGLEPGRNLASFARLVTAATPELERRLAGLRGVDIENKRYSLAIHYRSVADKRKARTSIEAAVRQLDSPMRMIAGKLLVNVVPAGAPHKGDALEALRARERADIALYVGDDITDEDVFELDRPGWLLGVRVGRSRQSAAPYFLRDQREVDALLSRLCALRARPVRRRS